MSFKHYTAATLAAVEELVLTQNPGFKWDVQKFVDILQLQNAAKGIKPSQI